MTASAERHRRGGGHWLAAGIASVLSVVAHVMLVEVFPELPVGRPPEIEATPRREAMTMRDVRPREPVRLEQPPRFRPEDPAVLSPSEEATRFVEAVEPVLSTADTRLRPEAPPPDMAVGEPEAVRAPPVPWEPRQDVFAIEHGLYTDDVRANPRRFVDVDTRVAEAPDIVVPVARDEISWFSLPELPDTEGYGDAALAASFARALAEGVPVAVPNLAGPGADGGGDVLREVIELAGAGVLGPTAFEPVEALLDLMLEIDKPAEEPGHTYFRIAIQRRDADAMPVMPKDVLLMQDCSESMTQRKLDACKEGLRAVVGSLGPEDRFDLMSFRDRTTRCFGYLREASPQAKARAVFFIEAMEARGKTDVYDSLKTLMEIERQAERPLVALLVTDGRPTTGLVDSSDIIEQFTRKNLGEVSVFALGGGRQVNRFLLDLLSYRNRGDSKVVESRRDLAPAIHDLGGQLSRPVMIDLRYRFSGVEEGDLYPRTLTHLFLDRPLVIYGHYRGKTPRTAFQIVGVSADGKKDIVFDVDWDEARPGTREIRRHWAYHQVYELIGSYVETGREEVLDRAHAVADRFGLAVPYGRDVVFR